MTDKSVTLNTDQLILDNGGRNDKVLITVSGGIERLDFEGMEYVEADKFQTKELYNENSSERSGNEIGAKMISFSSNNRIDFHSRSIDNAVLYGPVLNGVSISNPSLDYPVSRAGRVLILDADGDVSFTVGGGDSTPSELLVSDVVKLADDQILSTKTLNVSDNTINGLTAGKIAVADGSGKLTGSSTAISDLVDLTTIQTLTSKTLDTGTVLTSNVSFPSNVVQETTTQTLTEKTMTEPTLNNALMGGTIRGPTGQNQLTLGSLVPAVSSVFLTDCESLGKMIGRSGLLTGSTISHYLTSSPFTETTCLTLDGSGNVDVANNLDVSGTTTLTGDCSIGGNLILLDNTIMNSDSISRIFFDNSRNLTTIYGGLEVSGGNLLSVDNIEPVDGLELNILAGGTETLRVKGNLRLDGENIRNSNNNVIMQCFFNNQNVVFKGDVEIEGNHIYGTASSTNGIFFDTGGMTLTGTTTLGPNINNSTGNLIMSFGTGTGATTTFAGNIKTLGTGILSSSGAQPIILSGVNTQIAGNIQVDGEVRLNDNIIRNSSNYPRITMDDGLGSVVSITLTGSCLPANNDSFDLGSSGKKWDNVYATNGSIDTSDERMKSDITDSDLGLDFINQLRPVSYKWNNKNRKHYGLLAQQVKVALEEKGCVFDGNKTQDFAGYIYDDNLDEYTTKVVKSTDASGNIVEETVKEKREYTDAFGLRYTEFISPMIKSIQELYKIQTQELEQEKARNKDLEERLKSIEVALVSIMSKLN